MRLRVCPEAPTARLAELPEAQRRAWDAIFRTLCRRRNISCYDASWIAQHNFAVARLAHA